MTKLRLVTLLALLSIPLSVAALITGPAAHTTAQATTNPSTSGINTTTASLLIQGWAEYDVTPCSGSAASSPSTTWTALTTGDIPAVTTQGKIIYAANPTTGASQTFFGANADCYAALLVNAWAGVKASSPFDQQSGATSNTATSTASGSITPTENCELIISISAFNASSTETVDSGMTIIDQLNVIGGVAAGQAIAYKIQTTAAAINPTWSGSNIARIVRTASFKAASCGTAGSSITLMGAGH